MILNSRSLLLRIHELLDGKLDSQQAEQVATDYSQFCEQLQARIRQFSKLLKEGNYYAALDVAQLEPTLTTQLERIRFPRESEWRHFLADRGISCFPGFDDTELKRVKDVCADRSMHQPAGYRDFRKAILLKDKPGAIQHLRKLHATYPKDLNARQELLRFEKDAFDAIETELAQLLRLEKQELALQRVEATLRQEWIIALEGEAWQRALALHEAQEHRNRLDDLNHTLSQIKVIQRVGDWKDAQGLIEKLRSTRDSALYPELTAVQQNELNALLKWFHDHELEHDTALRNREAFDRFAGQLAPDALEAQFGNVPAKQVRQFQKHLALDWKRFEELTPDRCREQHAHYEQTQRFLESLLCRRRRGRSKLRWLWLLAIPVAAVAGGSLYWINQQEASLSNAVRSAYETRELESTQQALGQWDSFTQRFHSSRNPFRHYRAHRQVQEVRNWIQELKLRHAKIVELLDRTEAAIEGAPERSELRRTRLNLDIAGELLSKLPESGYPRAHARFLALQQTYAGLQQQQAQQLQSELMTVLEQIETRMQSILAPARSDFTDLQAALTSLREDFRSAEARFAQAFDLNPIVDLQERLNQRKFEVDAYESAHRSLQQWQGRLRQSIALSEYLESLRQLSELPLPGHPLVQQATRLHRQRDGFENLAQTLLLPGNAIAWEQFLKRMDEPLIAEGIDPKERTAWKQLSDEPILREIYRYRLYRYQDGAQVGSFRWLYTNGEAEISIRSTDSGRSEVTSTVREFDQQRIGRGVPFVEASYSCEMDAAGAPVNGERLEFDRLSPESGYYREIEALCGFQAESDGFSRPLLDVIDTVKQEQFISPIFKAWILQELFDLMVVRALDWGLNFCPAAQLEYRNLATIKGTLFPYDWLRPSTQNRILQPLTRYFESLPKHSYHTQAIASRELFKQISRQRVRYGGYVSEDGLFMLLSGTPQDRKLFGMRENGSIDVLRAPGADEALPTQFPGEPYSPIMFFNDPPRVILDRVTRNTGVDVNAEAFRPFLPPIFLDSR